MRKGGVGFVAIMTERSYLTGGSAPRRHEDSFHGSREVRDTIPVAGPFRPDASSVTPPPKWPGKRIIKILLIAGVLVEVVAGIATGIYASLFL